MTIDLSEFDAPSLPAGLAPTTGPVGTPKMPNGHFTLTFPDGSHRTFRVHTKTMKSNFAPGQRVLSMLIGPDRTDDFEPFAFVQEDGFRVWKRFKGQKQERYSALLWMMAAEGCEGDGHELKIAKYCLRCNRLLTGPDAIDRGYGEHCWKLLTGGG